MEEIIMATAITENAGGITGLKCNSSPDVCRKVTWRYIYPDCPKINMLCNPYAGAYVAAITVCNQQLWNYTDVTACD